MGRTHGLPLKVERKERAKAGHPQEMHKEGVGQNTRNPTGNANYSSEHMGNISRDPSGRLL